MLGSMNTPSNKRYSSSSEYATPGMVDDSENSLYFSFTGDDNLPNKENAINGDSWSMTDVIPSPSPSQFVSKAKTPLLRKVLQSNFTPRNKSNKRVSFSHLPKQSPVEATGGKIAKTVQTYEHRLGLNSNNAFDLEPIKESLPNPTIALDQKSFSDNSTEQDANSDTADVADDLDNTIIENPSLMKHNTDLLAKTSESNASGMIEVKKPNNMNDTPNENPKHGSKMVHKILSEAATKPHQTRNVTKIDRRQLVKESRKSMLPVTKKSARFTTYKRRSSTYEPRKINPRKSLEVLKQVAHKISKSISGK